MICQRPTFLIGIPKRQLHKKDYLIIRFLIGLCTILAVFYLYFVIVKFSPFLKTSSSFHRNIIGSYISFFIPLNVISWIALGQIGGILVLIFSCLSIIFVVLRYGILYYNVYIVLFGISAIVGYRIFLNLMLTRNRYLANLEVRDVDKNTLSSGINQKLKDIDAAKNRVQRYSALKDITEDLSSTLDLEKIAALIVKMALTIIGRSDRALLFLIDESKQELELFASRQAAGLSPIKAKKGEIFDRWAVKQRKSLIVEDLDNDFRFSAEALSASQDRDFKSIIGVPVMSERKVTGVLRMDSREKDAYTQDDLRLLNIISDLAAVCIENSKLYQKTNELAIRDGLTGLYVQKYFKEKLDTEVKRTISGKKKFSVLMIDLDFFKDCNDKYGHTAGDILLVKIAEVLKNSAGEAHIVSRYGGEEFAILLSELNRKEAIKIAETIRGNVEKTVFTLRRHTVNMTISIGISSFPDDGYLAEALLKKADENLYKAKQNGRNRIWPSST